MSYQDSAPGSSSGQGSATAPGNFAYGFSNDDRDGSFAIIRGNGNVTLSGEPGKALEQAKRKYHNNFLWFERDGKSYVITDPAIMAQFNSYDQRNKSLEHQQAQLQMQQDALSQRMKEFDPGKARVMTDSPEMKRQMAELNRKLAELQSDKFRKMTDDINRQVNQEMLSNLQQQMGQIQSQIGELQGRIGEEMGRLGEKQGQLGEQMGRLGEQMGRIGEEQGRLADEMNQRVQSLIDRAMQNGTAKPVN
jgi:seryl-tRNA synthetase